MRLLLHPSLRALPRAAQRDLRSRIWLRLKSQGPRPSQRNTPKAPSKGAVHEPPTPTVSSAESVKTTMRKGPPERILIYYGGTGRAMFLGMMRVTTIFLFGAACFLVAPFCYADEERQWMTPLVIAGGAVPMISFAYVASPYVNFIHLALPAFARRSREMAAHYAKDLPPTAVLYLNTMRWNTIPRQTTVRLGDLVSDRDPIRPVTFRNLKPVQLPWWRTKAPTQFFAAAESKPGRQTTAFYPEMWPAIYNRIQSQAKKR
ncbi:hypothetical protein N7532_009339 [Penicillium argentinense]|uniref:Uncharacterized protein n=1 Tax=Penicillium argentinense TaxID=1131581 RepID=A0A9W9EZC8_9EURO|nr:uncharacterized protein N7532_009339 [Penicillium argentinense]KAJ5090655.1 hypothetical protein N7532_009339 [Penicillium argentinense]